MGLRTAFGLKKRHKAPSGTSESSAGMSNPEPGRPVTLDLSLFDAFDESDGFLPAYREAIMASQNGMHDNPQKQFRYFILHQLALRACRETPDLDVVECGCFLGHSTFMLARLLEANGFRGRLHVFDSFEGLSDFQEKDSGPMFSTEESKTAVRKHFRSDFDRVNGLLARFSFVHLYKGWIPARFDDAPANPISLLSIDVDLYEPTLQSLQTFFPRLTQGGSVFLDDYGSRNFPGARRAVDEYLAGTPHQMLVRMPFASAFLTR